MRSQAQKDAQRKAARVSATARRETATRRREREERRARQVAAGRNPYHHEDCRCDECGGGAR